MSRRPFSVMVATGMMLVLALAATGAAQAAPSKVTAKEKAERARVVKYWTPARMANAKPRDFVKTKRGFVPAAKGGNKPDKGPKDPGDGGSSSTVTGASWTDGGPALNATGKVFFTMGGSNYTCSGAAMRDGGRSAYSVVLTAGHCAYDETNGRFASNWMFKPAYDSDPTGCTNGCYVAKALAVHDGYATSGGFNSAAIKHDWAFAVVLPDGNTQLDGSAVDEFAIEFTAKNESRYSFGYPASGKYAGQDLVYCAGDVITDSSYGTWGLQCDMTPGSSGGPWMKDFSTSTKSGTLNSVNSYKYNGGRLKNYMFGPKFGDETRSTRDAAFAYIDGKQVAAINGGSAEVGVLVP